MSVVAKPAVRTGFMARRRASRFSTKLRAGEDRVLEVNEIGQALDAVREMKTRAFGQVLTFLYSGALLAQQYEGEEPAPLRDILAQMTQQFCAARPTFDFSGLGDFFDEWFAELPAGDQRSV